MGQDRTWEKAAKLLIKQHRRNLHTCEKQRDETNKTVKITGKQTRIIGEKTVTTKGRLKGGEKDLRESWKQKKKTHNEKRTTFLPRMAPQMATTGKGGKIGCVRGRRQEKRRNPGGLYHTQGSPTRPQKRPRFSRKKDLKKREKKSKKAKPCGRSDRTA